MSELKRFIILETRCLPLKDGGWHAIHQRNNLKPFKTIYPWVGDNMSVLVKSGHVKYVLIWYGCIPDCVATEIVWVSTVAFLGTGMVMEALEERVGLTLQERPFSSFFTSSSSVPVNAQVHKHWLVEALMCMFFVLSIMCFVWGLSLYFSTFRHV